MVVNRLYTIGYQGLRGIYQLLNLVIPLDATIIDIRYAPWSKDEEWREENLLKTLCDLQFGGLKCRYVHIKELGNVNYKSGGPIEIWLPEVGVARLEEWLKVKPAVLLCRCPNVETCHRKVVAELAERWIEGLEVEHLTRESPVPAVVGGVRPVPVAVEPVPTVGLGQPVKTRPAMVEAVKVEQGQLSMF